MYKRQTGYYLDAETGNYHARARPYSPTLGRFIGRDPVKRSRTAVPRPLDGYKDSYSLYLAYFAPNALDPSGKYVTVDSNIVTRTDSPPPGGEWMGGPDHPWANQRSVATAQGFLTYHSSGDECGDPLTLKLVIKTGNLDGTEIYFDDNREHNVVRPKCQAQLASAGEVSDMGNDTYEVTWKIPTECGYNETNCCKIKWCDEGYGIEFSVTGDSPTYTWPEEPTVVHYRRLVNSTNWQEGTTLSPTATIKANDSCIVTESSGSISISPLGPGRQ